MATGLTNFVANEADTRPVVCNSKEDVMKLKKVVGVAAAVFALMGAGQAGAAIAPQWGAAVSGDCGFSRPTDAGFAVPTVDCPSVEVSTLNGNYTAGNSASTSGYANPPNTSNFSTAYMLGRAAPMKLGVEASATLGNDASVAFPGSPLGVDGAYSIARASWFDTLTATSGAGPVAVRGTLNAHYSSFLNYLFNIPPDGYGGIGSEFYLTVSLNGQATRCLFSEGYNADWKNFMSNNLGCALTWQDAPQGASNYSFDFTIPAGSSVVLSSSIEATVSVSANEFSDYGALVGQGTARLEGFNTFDMALAVLTPGGVVETASGLRFAASDNGGGSVPIPGTLPLAGLGFLALGLARRKGGLLPTVSLRERQRQQRAQAWAQLRAFRETGQGVPA
jgi:hypothetical protein